MQVWAGRRPALLSRLAKPRPDEFRQIFHWDRTVLEDRLVIAAQVELVPQLTFNLLTQTIAIRSQYLRPIVRLMEP